MNRALPGPIRLTLPVLALAAVLAGVLSPADAGAPQLSTAAATEAPSDACGVQPAKADGSYWTCTFAEEFDGTELDRSRWMPATNFSSGDDGGVHACYRDDPANVSVSDGALHLTLLEVAEPECAEPGVTPTVYQSGSVSTYHLFSQQYGRFEARVRNTPTDVPGLQESFWLWPDDRVPSGQTWPAAGEIDVAETYSQYPHLAIPFLHYTWYDNLGSRPGLNTAWNCPAERGVYNTYAAEWTPTTITITVNGTTCLVNRSGDAAFQKPYIVALSQLIGVKGNAPRDDTPIPATTDVDYVHVWQ